MKRIVLYSMLLVLLIGSTAYAEVLQINGSSTVMGKIMSKIKVPFEKASGIELVLSTNGSLAGAKDLIAGKCAASVSSDNFEDLKKAVPELAGIADIKVQQLGSDNIAVIVNKQNPVSKLTMDQVKGLNTGKVKNWKEVGGADSDVIVVTSVKGSGTRQTFNTQAMNGEPYASDAVEASTTMAELKEVSSMKEAIGAVSESFVNDTVKKVDAPAIGRPLLILTKGEPSASVKKLIDFILGDGQKYLK
ncbi:MAG: substrate-binding domain-containing protein [Nitrospirae bacterium]|nr:substrate-binding domain-containing protein [Nitrospirota bacterium]